MFDGSSIEGFVRIEESDMYLHPDLDTFMIFPWRPQQGKVARIICDVYMADGTPFEGDPRYILKKQIEKAKQMGYIFNVGPECEFFLFHLDENGQPTTISHERAGLVVMWVAVNAAELLDRINKLDFKAMGVTIGILYIAFMAVYIFVTIVVYTARYKAGRREVRKYANHLKAVGRIYSREEKIKR